MRFDSVGLLRYGHFTDRTLAFPAAQAHDFQLIVGHNEAGKSTLRAALRDLLFGIPMTTPMSFRHPGPELVLAATVSGAPGRLQFERRRKRNGGLLDARGEALPAEALRPWLGEVNDAFFERMFGLDHRRLEAGARAMLQAGDSVDSILFQAAAGVSALNEVLAQLRTEANGLWAARRSRERAWYMAADRLAEAESALKAATVRPSAWVEAHKESRRLDAALRQAQDEHAAVLAQVREHERLRRMAPLLAQIRQHEALLNEHTAAADDTLLLQNETEITRLEALRVRVADHPMTIERSVSRDEVLKGQLAQVLRELGRPQHSADPAELDALQGTLPSRPARREVEQLLTEGQRLRAEAEAAARAHAEREAERAHLGQQIATLPAVTANEALRLALAAADAAGDIDARLSAAQRTRGADDAALQRCLSVLAQPGSVPGACGASRIFAPGIDELAAMQPWPSSQLVEQAQQRQRLQNEIDTLDKRLREAQLECAQAALELEQFTRSHVAVTRDDVVAARRERDTVWQALVNGEGRLEVEGERYAALVRSADTLADQHLAGVDEAARLQSIQREHERKALAVQGLQSACDAARRAFEEHEQAWAQACSGRGLPLLTPAALQDWQHAREAALSAHERCRQADEQIAELQAHHARVLNGLQQALSEDAAQTGGADSGYHEVHVALRQGDLAALRERAAARLNRARQAEARHAALSEQCARIDSVLPGLDAERRRAEQARSAWQQRWQDALRGAGLPAEAHDAYVETALALLADADQLVAQLRESRAERTRMAAELQAFRNDARRLADLLGDTAFEEHFADTHVRRWVAELAQARQRRRDELESRQRLAALNEQLLAEGEGRSRQEIEAELDAVDVADFAARAEALAAQLEHVAARRSALAVECENARKALEAISGGDAAAQAEARRQEALADMAEVADRYVRLYVEMRLLERVTEQYRERRQGPLLARAGQLFADLTLGAHAGLVVDADAATLQARRADGSLVALEGLSDGTRDQLYLALRLAALHLYLDHATPVPFIADDLFVNYDDRRAVAALRKLGELSERTQVIFLTHHAHMLELAREALGERMHVTEL